MKSSGIKLSLLLCIGLFATVLYAKPTGMKQVHGNASIKEEGNVTSITTDHPKSILHWNDFSIGEKETTRFMQPTSSSSVLNRVVQENPSKILGNLESNGTVYLVNPYGVFFGENARINTAAFVASTFDILNEDFLNKTEMLFKGDTSASIINYGTLETSIGDVTLIGKKIENHGNISAKNGEVHLAAGVEVLLKPEECQVLIKPCQEIEEKEDVGIDNKGNIEAIKASLQADGNLYELAINHSGHIDAFGVMEKDGEIFLIAEDGSSTIKGDMTAANANDTGGNVFIFTKDIIVEDTAVIDASGKNKGGEILIGGDYQGQTENYINAQNVVIYPNAKILADAKENGNGGKVIVWAENACHYYGHISTRGGEFSGDGGFVEVSSHGPSYTFRGTADRLAPNGENGTILLDPTDIHITDNGGTSNPAIPPIIFTYPGAGYASNTSTLDVIGLQTLLNSGSTTVSTSTSGGGSVDGNITIDAAILNWTTTNNLMLNAHNDITFSTDQTWTSTGDITVTSTGGNININASLGNWINQLSLQTVTGDIIFGKDQYWSGDSATFAANASGNITLNAGIAKFANTGIAQFTAGSHFHTHRDCHLQLAGGYTTVNVTDQLNIHGRISLNGGNLILNSSSYTQFTYNTTINGSSNLTLNAGDDVFMHGIIDASGSGASLTINASGNNVFIGHDSSETLCGISSINNADPLAITCEDLQISGGSGSSAEAYIHEKNGTINLNIAGKLYISGGSGDNSSAYILQTNENASNNMAIYVGNVGEEQDLYITAGTGNVSDAYILLTQLSDYTGNMTVDAKNIYMTGGGATPGGANHAQAYIEIDAEGALTVTTHLDGDLNIIGGTQETGPAFITKDGTYTGGIEVHTAGKILLEGRESFASIYNNASPVLILGTPLKVTADSGIELHGSANNTNAYASIVHGGDYGNMLVETTALTIEANKASAHISLLNSNNQQDLTVRTTGHLHIYGATDPDSSGYIQKAGKLTQPPGGDVTIVIGSGLLVEGRSGAAYIRVASSTGTSNMSVTCSGSDGITLYGGTADTGSAYITSDAFDGDLLVDSQEGYLFIEANQGSAYISVTNTNNSGDLTVNAYNDLVIYGGMATTALGYIARADSTFNPIAGGQLDITTDTQDIILDGRHGPAFILSSTTDDVNYANIDINPYRSLYLLGGRKGTSSSQAYIRKNGYYGAYPTPVGKGHIYLNHSDMIGHIEVDARIGKAFIESNADGAIDIAVPQSHIFLYGGDQGGAEAYIRNYVYGIDNNLNISIDNLGANKGELFIEANQGNALVLMNTPTGGYSGTGDLNISTNGEDVHLLGGDNIKPATFACATVQLVDCPGSTLEFDNVGTLELKGGTAQEYGYALIAVDGTAGSSNLSVKTTKDLLIQGGEGFDCYARIRNITGGSSTIDCGGNLALEGGAGGNATAVDVTISADSDATIVTTGGGNLRVNALNGNIYMRGGSGGNATAEPNTAGSYATADASAKIECWNGGNLLIQTNTLKMSAGEGGNATGTNTTAAWTAQASGKADAKILSSGGGSVTINLSDNLIVEGHNGGNVTIENPTATTNVYGSAQGLIIAEQAPLIITPVDNVNVIGGSGGNQTVIEPIGGLVTISPNASAIISALNDGSSLTITASQNIMVKGGQGLYSSALINVENGGSLICQTPGGDVSLYGGSSRNLGRAGIYAIFSGAGTLNVWGRNVYLYGGYGHNVGDNSAFIQADNDVTNLNATYVDATNGSVILNGGQDALAKAWISSKNAGSHTLMVRANYDLYIGDKSTIENEATGDTTLICDDQFPLSPFYGNGTFTIKSTGSLTAAGKLRIFTSQRVLNVIETTINGFTFVASDVPDDQEQWPVWYYNPYWGSNGFVLFYKVGDLIPGPVTNYWINRFMAALWNKPEMFVIRPYEKYIPVNRAFKISSKNLASGRLSFSSKEGLIFEEDDEYHWMQKSWLEPSTPYNPTTMNHF